MKKNNLLLITFFILFLQAVQVFYGCGVAPLKEGEIPEQDTVCDKKADEALKNNQYEKSIILHEFFLKENSDNGLAMYHLGFSYGHLGDHDNEIECYEKAINLGFYGSGIFFNLGMVYGEMGKYEDSVRVFKKAIKIDPDQADNHFGLALAYQRMGSYALAEKEYKKAIKLDPENVDTLYFLGLHYVETSQFNDAKKQLKNLTKIDPDNEMALELKRILENK